MRRPPAVSVLALILIATAATVFADGQEIPASGAVDQIEMPAEEHEPAPTEGVDEDEEPLCFDSLWLLLVGVVGVMLVIRMVRTEWRWHRRIDDDNPSRNEFGLRDVLTDE